MSRPRLSTRPLVFLQPQLHTPHCALSPQAGSSSALRTQPAPEPTCRKDRGPPLWVPAKARPSSPGVLPLLDSGTPAGLPRARGPHAPACSAAGLWLARCCSGGLGAGAGEGLRRRTAAEGPCLSPWLPSEQGAQDLVRWLLAAGCPPACDPGPAPSLPRRRFQENGGCGLSGLSLHFCCVRQCRRHGFEPWVRKTPWRRRWQPTKSSCLENPTDRGAWRATVHGVPKESDTAWRLNKQHPILRRLWVERSPKGMNSGRWAVGILQGARHIVTFGLQP